MGTMPYLKKENGRTTLMVEEKPYLMLGGELHNSSASDLRYMEEKIWPACRAIQLNTVVLPVSWELIEPQEGSYDFSLVEGLLLQARREGVKLVLLWFGLWKNAQSSYVPGWVKTQGSRFFHVRDEFSRPLRTISPFCREAVQADAKAFAALLAFLRRFDGEENTVILVQAENEIGIIGSDRDHCPTANQLFAQEVPEEVAAAFGVTGTWEQAFGEEAGEQFMAWGFARAVEEIVQAGQKEYPLPIYVNAWLEQFPEIPGNYPCGGPVYKRSKMWKAMAPSIAFLAPDIYVDQFRDVCDEYATEENALFIPEVRNTVDAVPFLFYAVGKHNALGFCPFGVEDMAGAAQALDPAMLATLNIDPAALGTQANAGALLGKAYGLLGQMDQVLERARAAGTLHAFLEAGEKGTVISLTNYDVKIAYDGHHTLFSSSGPKLPGNPLAGGILFEEGDSIYVTAVCSTLEFLPKKGVTGVVDLLRKEEGRFVENQWQPGRVLNGDEQYFNRFSGVPETQRFVVYTITE